jgi:hypothetical protein
MSWFDCPLVEGHELIEDVPEPKLRWRGRLQSLLVSISNACNVRLI